MHLCACAALLCLLLTSCSALNNQHTELLPGEHAHLSPHVRAQASELHSNETMNRARSGGTTAARETTDRGQLGCRELRSTKYISDGRCTSLHPVKEVLCTGECLPSHMLSNWIGGASSRKLWGRRSSEHDCRCVNDKTRSQRIRLQCQDGGTRTYKITVVTSCKCKRYSRTHNESGNKSEKLSRASPLNHKSTRRKEESRASEIQHLSGV